MIDDDRWLHSIGFGKSANTTWSTSSSYFFSYWFVQKSDIHNCTHNNQFFDHCQSVLGGAIARKKTPVEVWVEDVVLQEVFMNSNKKADHASIMINTSNIHKPHVWDCLVGTKCDECCWVNVYQYCLGDRMDQLALEHPRKHGESMMAFESRRGLEMSRKTMETNKILECSLHMLK